MKVLMSLLIAAIWATSAHGAPMLLNAAGATFPAPLYAKWFSDYRQVDPSVEVNYQAIGSGGGVRQFIAGTTDFGASDDPMKDSEMKEVKGGMLHIPTVIGGVVMTYNIAGVKTSLHFSPEVIADIYMGKITKWNDPMIMALNKGVHLPSQNIIVCYRADGSGTTAIFTGYLASHSNHWMQSVGAGKAVKFPTGLGGKGNDGVTGLVRQNPGAIGYVEMTYAMINHLPMAGIKNSRGQIIAPTLEALTAACVSLL